MNLKDKTIVIDKRFNGPPTSGNGGYVCGLLSQIVDGPAVTVRLLLPTPIDTELEVRKTGRSVVLLDGGVVLAEARPAKTVLKPPACPNFEDAEEASCRYRGFTSHWFPCCFVCGPDRGDGPHVFPGPVKEGKRFACPWIPDASVIAGGGPYLPSFYGPYSIARDPSPFPSLQAKRLFLENSKLNYLEMCP